MTCYEFIQSGTKLQDFSGVNCFTLEFTTLDFTTLDFTTLDFTRLDNMTTLVDFGGIALCQPCFTQHASLLSPKKLACLKHLK